MFSIKNDNPCKTTKVIQTGLLGSPIFYSGGVTYNNKQIVSSPNLSCIINSTKTKLEQQSYNGFYNKPQ